MEHKWSGIGLATIFVMMGPLGYGMCWCARVLYHNVHMVALAGAIAFTLFLALMVIVGICRRPY
jgi:hypothetical protein